MNANEKKAVKTENASEKSAVNAKATANVKANEMLFEKMLENFDKSFLKTSMGAKNEVFKQELFADIAPDKIKSYRKQLRLDFLSICYSIDKHYKENNLNKLDATIAHFIATAKKYFIVFDFNNLQVSMFCSPNMKDTNKNSIQKAIDAINERVKQLSK